MRSRYPILAQLKDNFLLTDGGLETTLVFHHGFDLPQFAAFVLLDSEQGRQALRDYFRTYLDIAVEQRTGFLFESPTWRANPEWGAKIGYSPAALDRINREAIAMMAALRDEYSGRVAPMLISGCIGPRDDGYSPEAMMDAEAAQRYHQTQIDTFAGSGADLVSAITMTYVEEGVGIARAAQNANLPAVISFTVETDGRLPNGQPLRAAIEQIEQEAGEAVAHYMINCAHPSHFADVIDADEAWTRRIRGVRANASRRSHAELDAADELDDGDPAELAEEHRQLLSKKLRHVNIVGGCCGTDHRHVAAIARRCAPATA